MAAASSSRRCSSSSSTVPRHLLLLLLLLALLSASCWSSTAAAAASTKKDDKIKGSRWRQPPPPPPPPGSELFRRKEDGRDPLQWDDDDLLRVRDLHSRSFANQSEFLAAKNLADYLGLGEVEQVHLALPLHVVFVGFMGDGNQRVRVDELTLTEWFAHLDHVLPHARVSLADLTCLEDGHCAGFAAGTADASPPLPSAARLNFSCNVVAVQKAEVLAAYERAVAAFSRPVDPDFETGAQQVDALKMEAFIDSFVEGLGLDSAYTLVVVNPKWSASLASYGFRAGFSTEELALLQEQVPALRQLSLSHWEGAPAPPRGHALQGHGFHLGGWRHRVQKFAVSQLQAESMAWARTAQAYLDAEEDHRRKLLKAVGPRTKGALSVARAVGMLRAAGESETAQLLGATIMLPPEHFHNPKWGASHPLEDCLVPSWVGHGRWLLLDLTATKADYGPALGGEGVVQSTSLPDVASLFSEVNEAREAARDERVSGSDEEQRARADLHARVGARATSTEDPQHRALLEAQVRAVYGTKPGEELDADEARRREQEALLHAELDVYEAFATQHCHNRINPPAACAEARDAALEIRHELQGLAGGSTGKLRAFRDHHWDIFGLDDADEGSKPVADAAARAREHFLGSLSSALSRGLRHVVAPPGAAWRREGEAYEAASPYAQRVHFTLHMFEDTSRRLAGDKARRVRFDAKRFEAQVARLALPQQTFTFSVVEANLLDDPQLATAFAASTRTALAEVPDALSHPAEAEVVFVDSRELAAHLRARFEHPVRHGRGGRRGRRDARAVLEVPVYIFGLDRDVPVLLDEHYNARALDDMILVIENAAHQDEHPAGFACNGALLSRPLSPLRHALAAALRHLGGVLPPHLGHHPGGRGGVAVDWLWSVGAHPLSWTSTGTAYSQLHIDALHRGYVIDALDRSIATVNEGVALLAADKPSPEAHARVLAAQVPLRQALATYAHAVGTWRTAAAHLSMMEFKEAVDGIAPMEEFAEAFLDICREIHDRMHPQRCAARVPLASSLLRALTIGSALAVVVTLALTCGLPMRKKKAI